MKALKVLGTGILALSLATAAQASTTVIHITGSSAFRKAVHQAIQEILNSGYTYGYTGSSVSGASAANFRGTTKVGGNDVLIKTAFSGSVGGVQTVSQQIAPSFGFLPDNTVLSGTGTGGYAGATINATGVISNNAQSDTTSIPEVCMTDAFQASTPFGSSAPAPYTAADLTDNTVGVVQFKWVANVGAPSASTASTNVTTTNGSSSITVSSTTGLVLGATASGNSAIPAGAYVTAISGNTVTLSVSATSTASSVATNFTYAGISNITPYLAQQLFIAGNLPLAQFSGSGYDRTHSVTSTFNGNAPVQVYAIGRDADSGTRINAFADSGIGTASSVAQYAPLDVNNNIIGISGTNIISNQDFYPAETLNTISYALGNTGYNSGGNLAAAMKATNSLAALGGYYVTYLGINDAATALAGGAHELTYNGVAYSDAAVQEGEYSFWGYEHLDYLQSYSGTGRIVADQIKDQIAADASLSGLPLNSMHVQRLGDGAVITALY